MKLMCWLGWILHLCLGAIHFNQEFLLYQVSSQQFHVHTHIISDSLFAAAGASAKKVAKELEEQTFFSLLYNSHCNTKAGYEWVLGLLCRGTGTL